MNLCWRYSFFLIRQSFAEHPKWLNDDIRSITNPSNRMISYDVDAVGRTSRVWAAAKVYADMIVASTPYTPDGRLRA